MPTIDFKTINNFLFHPFADEHSAKIKQTSIITSIFLILFTRGLWLIPLATVYLYDRYVKQVMRVELAEESAIRRVDEEIRPQIPFSQPQPSVPAPQHSTILDAPPRTQDIPTEVPTLQRSAPAHTRKREVKEQKVSDDEQINDLISKAGQMKAPDIDAFIHDNRESFERLLNKSKNQNYPKRYFTHRNFKDLPLRFFLRILLSKNLDFSRIVEYFLINSAFVNKKDYFIDFANAIENLNQKGFEKALDARDILHQFRDFEELRRYITIFLDIEEKKSKDFFIKKFETASHACDFVDRYGKYALYGLCVYRISTGNEEKWDAYINDPQRLESVLMETEENLIQFQIREGDDNNELHRLLLMFDNQKLLVYLNQDVKGLLSQTSLGNTPLHLACKTANQGAVLKMLEQIEDPDFLNKRDSAGMTPLHWAAFFCMDDAIKALIEKGADSQLTNSQGQKPVDLYTLTFDELGYFANDFYDSTIIADGRTKLNPPLTGMTDILFHMDKLAYNYLGLRKREILFSARSLRSSDKFRDYYMAFKNQFIECRNGKPVSESVLRYLENS